MQEKITKTLALMRHGEAEDASPDYTRKLTWKGEEQVYSVAEQLQQKRLRFDIILASGASRTTQTATIIHEYFEQEPQLLISPHLYNFSLGACQDVLEFLRTDIQSILIVGHNPGISKVSNQISRQKMYFSTAHCTVMQIETVPSTGFSESIIQENWKFLHSIAPQNNSI